VLADAFPDSQRTHFDAIASASAGSTSPAKVQAAESAFAAAFSKQTVTVHSVTTDINRARNAVAAAAAATADAALTVDYAVGVEGGVEMIDSTMQCFSWTAVIEARTGVLALSRSGSFAVHPRVRALVLAGTELGAACDAVYNTAQGKGAGGLIGVMTQGLVTRTQLYSHALLLALTRFTAPVLEPN
jgi:inosine/xanthosine triphosphatase